MDRKKYQADEFNYPELIVLLDAYQISDSLTQDHLRSEELVMCAKGCSNCCKSPTVPFTEPELVGLSWYTTHKLVNPLKDRVKQRLYDHEATTECPFLIDNECSVYEVRPLICRQFYVKNKACTPNEDILSVRPQDIIAPIRSIAKASLVKLLDFWPYPSMLEREEAFEGGIFENLTIYMHEYDWAELAKTMDNLDELLKNDMLPEPQH